MPLGAVVTAPLTTAERTRLVHILDRLGSEHSGERAAAGLLASRLLGAKGLTWDEIVAGRAPFRPPPFPPHSPHQSWRGWRGDVALCLRFPKEMTPWEIEFVGALHIRRAPPTPRQTEILAKIVAKLRAMDEAGAL